jgi:nucleoside-triphosphatase
MKRAYLLTGGPGVGKTSLIKQAIGKAQGRAGGFFTEEIRAGGVRQGFRIITLDGRSAILAHVDIESPYRVSKYGVDIEGLDEVGVAALREAIQVCDLVVIDEIGKMELFSPHFKEAVLAAINSNKRVLGTIMLSSHPWADEIKRHPNVALITLSRMNRGQVLEQVLQWLKAPINEDRL